MYLIKRLLLIPSAHYQTKKWRKAQSWYRTGKSNECEIYQLDMLRTITNLDLAKTIKRINLESYDIVDMKFPLKTENGFEYTENFDGLQIINDKHIYFNLKFVCDAGGAQTRSLREVYHFIKSQLNYLLLSKSSDTYFMNVLDGDTCYAAFSKYQYLLDQPQYSKIKKYIFVGDLSMFQLYWISRSI